MKRILYIGLIIAGFVLLIGTAGASDAGATSLLHVIITSLISVILAVAGIFGLDLEERRERTKRNGAGKNI